MIFAGLAVVAYFASSLVGGLYTPPNSNAIGPSSSTDASASGAAAMARLLSERGHSVEELTVPLSAATLSSKGTLFVLDPADSITPDAAALRRYIDDGGRLVLGGPANATLLHAVVGPGTVPLWRPLSSGIAHPVAQVPEDAAVSAVLGGPSGSWQLGDDSHFRVFLQGSGGPLAIDRPVGRGTLVLLASTTALENGVLAQADDAAFALDLAQPAGAPVSFDEYDHGLGRSGTGLAGLPAHWRAGLLLALLAVLVWMWSAARRFGPPQPADRELIPARVAHVDAMAALLASGAPDRLATGASSLQNEGRETLRRMLRASPTASDAQLIELAATGAVPAVTAEVVTDLLRTPRSETEVIAEGRAFATLARHSGRQ
jgi:hypothetical protein